MINIIVRSEGIILIDKKFHNKLEAMEFMALLDQSYQGYDVTAVEVEDAEN